MIFRNELYRPVPIIHEIGVNITNEVYAATFPECIPRYLNKRWSERVGLGAMTDAEWGEHLCGFKPLPDNLQAPLAMAYHGHQFGVYNPEIGDGRGFLFAQLQDDLGRKLDLGTKGTGQTPWSRFGDGRLTLQGGVREVLAANYLEALGVYTSKPFALFETGEALHRNDEPSPARSAVLTRLSHSHIRFGTFQRLAFLKEAEGIDALTTYCLQHYFPDAPIGSAGENAITLLRATMAGAAQMIASWMAAGFVHGVMNTDNMVITGESFDYGPWRFLDASDPNFTAAYFDEAGRYRFGRQPGVGLWNLGHLAGSLTLIGDASEMEAVLAGYSDQYRHAFRAAIFQRLGIRTGNEDQDGEFMQNLFAWLTQSQAGWEQTFFDWFCADERRADASPQAALYQTPEFAPLRAFVLAREAIRPDRLNSIVFQTGQAVGLSNETTTSIWEKIASNNDWSAFDEKLQQIENLRTGYGFAPESERLMASGDR